MPRKHRKLRVVFWFFGFFALLFLTVCFVLRAQEPQLLFHPQTFAQQWFPLPNDFQEIFFADQTSALWCPISGSERVILYCHGNYGNISMREEWIRALQHHLRASVLLFDPPGYGKTPGKPTEQGCYRSAESAFSWLLARGFKNQQIVVWGKSLGGGMATEMAVRHADIRALVLLDSFSSVPDAANVLIGVPLGFLARNRFDNVAKIGQIAAPKIIIGGAKDALCPSWMTRKLDKAATEPKSLRVVRGRHHAELLSETEWRWIAEELRRFS